MTWKVKAAEWWPTSSDIPDGADIYGTGTLTIDTAASANSRDWDGPGNRYAPRGYFDLAAIGADLSAVLRVSTRCVTIGATVEPNHRRGIALYGPADDDACLVFIEVADQAGAPEVGLAYGRAIEGGAATDIGPDVLSACRQPNNFVLVWNGTSSAFEIPDVGFSGHSVAARTVSYWYREDDYTWVNVGDRAIAVGVAPTRAAIWAGTDVVTGDSIATTFRQFEVSQFDQTPTTRVIHQVDSDCVSAWRVAEADHNDPLVDVGPNGLNYTAYYHPDPVTNRYFGGGGRNLIAYGFPSFYSTSTVGLTYYQLQRFTASFWVSPDWIRYDGTIWSVDRSGGVTLRAVHLAMDDGIPNATVAFAGTGGPAVYGWRALLTGTTVVGQAAMALVSVTWNGTTCRLYVNGLEEDNDAGANAGRSVNYTPTNTTPRIGASAGGYPVWKGAIWDGAIYDTAKPDAWHKWIAGIGPNPYFAADTLIVPQNGGALVTLSGVFTVGTDYTVHFGPLGTTSDPSCYGGLVGGGYASQSLDGLTLTFVSPPAAKGTGYIATVDDGAGETRVTGFSVVEQSFYDDTFRARRHWPAWYSTGPRLLKREPRQDS